jgi:hypothetical protein
MKQLNMTAYNFSVSLILIPFFIILNFLNKKESKVIWKREIEIILLQTQILSIKPFNYKRLFSFCKEHFKTFCEAFVLEFYLKMKPILRMITYLTYICWEIDNFVIKSDIFRRFERIFLKNYRVTMTTALDTSCSENTMVLSARRGFLHACIF